MTPEDDPAPRSIQAERVLYSLAQLVSRVQEAVDRRNLDSARELLESDVVGFSLISFQRYRISELLVEFGVVAEPGSGAAGVRDRLRVVPMDSPVEHVRPARFKVAGGEQILGEFQVAGELKATVTLVRS